MDRDTKIIKTPTGGNEVVIKTWLSGREKRAIQSVFTNDMNFKDGKYEISGNKLSEAQDKTIEMIIVSIDGVTEKILDKVLDMRAEDYDFVLKEIDKVSNPSIEQEKK